MTAFIVSSMAACLVAPFPAVALATDLEEKLSAGPVASSVHAAAAAAAAAATAVGVNQRR